MFVTHLDIVMLILFAPVHSFYECFEAFYNKFIQSAIRKVIQLTISYLGYYNKFIQNVLSFDSSLYHLSI